MSPFFLLYGARPILCISVRLHACLSSILVAPHGPAVVSQYTETLTQDTVSCQYFHEPHMAANGLCHRAIYTPGFGFSDAPMENGAKWHTAKANTNRTQVRPLGFSLWKGFSSHFLPLPWLGHKRKATTATTVQPSRPLC